MFQLGRNNEKMVLENDLQNHTSEIKNPNHTSYDIRHKSYIYYPFGMVMPGRNYTSASGYRYGFNGMEKDDEVKGNNNSLDFGARIYDPRIGRWLSMDPLQKKYPGLSPYNFVANSPIIFVDPDGRAIKPSNQSANMALLSLLKQNGGESMYGLIDKGFGKNTIYTTNISERRFNKNARKAGLEGSALEDARAVFKVLQASEIVEIAVVSAEGTKRTKDDAYNVQTQNSAINEFMTNVDESNNLSPLETHGEIQNLLESGSPKGEGYGYYKDENGSTVNVTDKMTRVSEDVPLNGILIINNEALGETTHNRNAENGKSDEQVMQQGINSIQDEVD